MARSRGSRNRKKQNKSGSKNQNQSGKSRRGQKITARTYWGGHAGELPEPPVVRPSPDPAAIVRSLGTPPLPGQHGADEYFAAVYERAVMLATALATASDLVEERD